MRVSESFKAHPGFQGGDIAGVSSGVSSVSVTDRFV
jgi:hypothetical protein